MKKNVFIVSAAIMMLAMLVACGSGAKVGGEVPDQIDDVRIDWRGRSAGVKEPPTWVLLAASGDDMGELSKLPRLEGKKAIVMSSKGANLEIVETWLNTQAYAQGAQKIRTGVATSSNSALEGELAGPESSTMVNNFNNLFSQATLIGYGKEMDYWIKTRSKSKGIEEYTMFAVYSISKDDLKSSIDETFKRVESKTIQQQELKTKLNTQMDRLMESINF